MWEWLWLELIFCLGFQCLAGAPVSYEYPWCCFLKNTHDNVLKMKNLKKIFFKFCPSHVTSQGDMFMVILMHCILDWVFWLINSLFVLMCWPRTIQPWRQHHERVHSLLRKADCRTLMGRNWLGRTEVRLQHCFTLSALRQDLHMHWHGHWQNHLQIRRITTTFLVFLYSHQIVFYWAIQCYIVQEMLYAWNL